MRAHRYFIDANYSLVRDFWLHDQKIIHQWAKVLRYKSEQEVVLFDGNGEDRLYRITDLKENEAHLELVTQLEPNIPKRKVYLLWSVLKRQNNDLLIQKCTELGVSHFIPIITDRTIKKDINIERCEKIIIESSEQCGRSDIPQIRQPVRLAKAIEEYKNKIKLLVCDKKETFAECGTEDAGLIIGPEGGWSIN